MNSCRRACSVFCISFSRAIIYSVISLSWDMLSFKNFYHISWLLSLFEMDSDHLSLSSLWSSSDSFWLRSVTSRTCETGGLACSENFIGKLKVRTYTLGVLVRIRNIFKLRLDLVHIPWCESYKTTTRLIFFFRSTVISITCWYLFVLNGKIHVFFYRFSSWCI